MTDSPASEPTDWEALDEFDKALDRVAGRDHAREAAALRFRLEALAPFQARQGDDVRLMREHDWVTVKDILHDAAIKIALCVATPAWQRYTMDVQKRPRVYSQLISRLVQEAGGSYCRTAGLELTSSEKNKRLKRRERLEPNIVWLVVDTMTFVRSNAASISDELAQVSRHLFAHQLILLPSFLLNGAKKDASGARARARSNWLTSVTAVCLAEPDNVDLPWIEDALQWLRTPLESSGLPPAEDLAAERELATAHGDTPDRVTTLRIAADAMLAAEQSLAMLEKDMR